ncbi:MAG: DUF2142 domain-containing protein [Candidatus Binatia bacterium]
MSWLFLAYAAPAVVFLSIVMAPFQVPDELNHALRVGLGLGRAIELSVAQTFVAARVLNGLAACLAGFFALRICRRGRALMFATLLLPMTLSQVASASQDALIIGLSHVAIAMASRLLSEGRIAGTGEFSLYAAIVAATTMARLRTSP